MNDAFTLHCITWQSGVLLLQEVRATALLLGLVERCDAVTDSADETCRHALALSKNGKAIGCARLAEDGMIDRIIALPHVYQSRIEAALIEILSDYSQQVNQI